MLYKVYERYLSTLHFLFFLVLLSQPWIEHFIHSSTSLFWTLHHKLYAYTHLNMTTTFTKHLNHIHIIFSTGKLRVYAWYLFLFISAPSFDCWSRTLMKGYKDPCSGNRDFSITTSSGPVLPVEFGGTSQVEFCEVDIYSVKTGYGCASLSCRPLWLQGWLC